MRSVIGLTFIFAILMAGGAVRAQANSNRAAFQLITLDPGHFHASLVQKTMYPDVDPLVHVYAPGGVDLEEHLKRIDSFNKRAENPTSWREEIYTGPDFFQKMLDEKAGNVVVISGNNTRKTEYILKSIQAGFNVLADKPMVIEPAELPKLQQAFELAAAKHLVLYDIMTERFEINTLLQRALSQMPALFGELAKGTPDDPAIVMESVHYFCKIVAGSALKRPAWFFDVRQAGEGIVDVSTHLVDLVQWEAFPEQSLGTNDVEVLSAKRWPTPISPDQFKKVTELDQYPDYLKSDVKDGALQDYCNGELSYRIRGLHARVKVEWIFEPPTGGGDSHFSVIRGTKARLIIRQGVQQNYKPVLYVEKGTDVADATFESALKDSIQKLQAKYPGVGFRRDGAAWRMTVPDKYDVGHEAHFGQVTGNYLQSLRDGKLPAWEVPNMLRKYATIMKAYQMSR